MSNKKTNFLQTTEKSLMAEVNDKLPALPEGFNKERFVQNAIAVMKETKGIEEHNPEHVKQGLMKGAFLGLDFYSKECYLIPYGKELKFQTDYKGEVKMVMKYSVKPAKNVFAKVVREGDEFEEGVIDGEPYVKFKPVPFSNEPIIGAFAIVMFEDGSIKYETMSSEDIEKIRNQFSKAKDSPAWKKTPGEMYKKTVLRRLTKGVELDFASTESRAAFESSSDFEFKGDSKPTEEKSNMMDAFNEAEEAEFIEVEDEDTASMFLEEE